MAFKMKGSPMQRNFGIGASPMKDEKSDKRPEGKVNKEGTAVWRDGKWEILSLEDAKAMQKHMAANTPEAIAAELAKQAREKESEKESEN